MKEEKLQVNIEKELYEDAEKLYNYLGLDLESAVRVFLIASLREGGLPFKLKLSDYDSCCDCDCDCDCDYDCDCDCDCDCSCEKE